MKSPRILIVRLSAIGDAIQTMPVACACASGFPRRFWPGRSNRGRRRCLRGHEALDELIELPRGWLKSPGGVWRLRRRLHDLRFDTAIDVQSLTKSAILAWLSGAKRRIGFGNPGGRELSKWFNNQRVDPKATHVVDRYLELLRPLGIESPAVRFQVPEHEEDRAAAERMIGELGLGDGFAIINPGAGWPSKLWPTDRYAAVARHLGQGMASADAGGLGRPGRADDGRADRRRAGPMVHIAPPTTLPELAALARRAKLFIGSDTGPLHLAAAVGTPCVGLYGPWPAARHGPYGPQHIALQKMFFEGSARARRTAPAIYMESITTEMVCEACDRIVMQIENEQLQRLQ